MIEQLSENLLNNMVGIELALPVNSAIKGQLWRFGGIRLVKADIPIFVYKCKQAA